MKNLRERVKKEKKSTENTERNGNTRKSYTLFFNAHKKKRMKSSSARKVFLIVSNSVQLKLGLYSVLAS